MYTLRVLIPTLITFIVGIVLVAAIFIPRSPFREMDQHFSTYFDIVAAFAFILGGGNLVRMHGDKVYRKARDWPFSIVVLVGFLGTLIFGLLKLRMNFTIVPAGDYIGTGTWFKFIFDSMFTPLSAAMFSLLGFFVASASYRAFRAKTREATLLLVSAFIILLGRTPMGHYITGWLPDSLSWLDIPNLSNWILSFPNAAGQRAIMIGIALGIVSTSLKLILGMERTHLGGEE
ncbi:MAG: DUF4149 domain-containing protein [Candidatus Eisenbacteria bacterium]|uniref:DUF4149 domain-containing protein n=1 Tax=Eiseniibacteriota bacterium TaxID=2212470 RepID=A0A948RY39_UNCEI|nr:DUF4149 domain-containing protein [Candidatus Eisenbacteria bacterium]MBU1947168.1 DUF4149 domain-containing protein [Candidatus Eisenbacteria bacterium]MBU2691212.1 DUF4149 domain-containing protein [Candidatus Eisenbacteria bacterium]